MKGKDDAACAELNVGCDERQSGAGKRWVRVESAKSVKMSFWRPNCMEPVFVSKTGCVDQQLILVGAGICTIAVEKEEAVFHM